MTFKTWIQLEFHRIKPHIYTHTIMLQVKEHMHVVMEQKQNRRKIEHALRFHLAEIRRGIENCHLTYRWGGTVVKPGNCILLCNITDVKNIVLNCVEDGPYKWLTKKPYGFA